tara:strand:+ start:570 stop:1949 length:1380 start_codon:yes stop_codon:yes gene_type:complete
MATVKMKSSIYKKLKDFYSSNSNLYREIANDERVPSGTFIEPMKYVKQYIDKFYFEEESTNFAKNLDSRIHRWVPYLEGFSGEFVEELFQELNIGPQHRILDPFAGCGTTNLTCKLNKIPSVGIELNPTMHSILQTKLDWDVDLQELRKVIESFAIPKKITLEPPEFLDNERQFLPGILRNLCGIKQFIKGIKSDKVRSLMLTAFASILLDSSNLKRSPSVGYTKKNYLHDDYPVEQFEIKIEQIYEDLKSVQAELGHETEYKVHLGNSSVKILDADSIDYTITSPPYLNFFDYPGNYKLEMGWLEHVSSTKDLKRIKDEMVPCDNISRGLVKDYLEKDRIYDDEWLEYIERTIQENTDVRPRIRRRDFPGIVKKYFDDMAMIIQHVAHATKPDGMLMLVVGDSLLTDVYVPTDLLLVRIAEQEGFELEKIKITRSRRSGIRRSFRLRETVAYLRKISN